MQSMYDSDVDKTYELKDYYQNFKRKGKELSPSEEEALLAEIRHQPKKTAKVATEGKT